MRTMQINGKRRRIPPFPHHKYMIWATSLFFRMPNLLNILTMDKAITLTQLYMGTKNNCFVPRALLIDPTTACNLNCIGCWAQGYDSHHHLSLEKIDDILNQAEKLKMKYCFYSGGEPLVRKDDLLKLCDMHPHISFCAYTNGTLIDEAFADRVAQLGNFSVALSIEGFEEDTDFRRGNGVYEKVMHAMDILRARNIAFSFSVCYHAKNYEVICSDAFLDFMREKGCWMGWLFTYVPVGNNADVSLCCTAEQRAYVQQKIMAYSKKHNIVLIDFWNNGHLSAGCVAASMGFVHINARGDVEPCAFCHFSDSNIHDVSLVEALKSPFFAEFRKSQPFNSNPLRSCPLMDNPDEIVRLVEKTGAKSTELHSPEDVRDFANKTRPIAVKWAPMAKILYEAFPARMLRSVKRNMAVLGYKKKHMNGEKK